MIYIVYAYIYEYKCLKNIGIALDNRYKCSFDDEKKLLTISSQSVLSDCFWDNKGMIHSVSAIVGDNGAGKSTALSFLLDALAEGQEHSVNGVIVYEQNGRYRIYGKGIQVCADKKYVFERKLKRIRSFYYSGHFLPYIDSADLRTIEVKGTYLASDVSMLCKDVSGQGEESQYSSEMPFHQHLYSYVLQNNYRICMLLANSKLRGKISYNLPSFIKLEIDTSGARVLQDGNDRRFESIKDSVPSEPECSGKNPRLRILARWIYHILLNRMVFSPWSGEPLEYISIIEDWKRGLESTDDAIGCLKDYLKGNNSLATGIRALTYTSIELFERMVEILDYENDIQGEPVFYLNVQNDSDKVERLAQIERNLSAMQGSSRFCVLKYSQELNQKDSILSSGEMEMLNMLSRLYEALVLRPHIQPTPIIMLDEAETGFHPEWQRCYLKTIIEFVTSMDVSERLHFQIIITTHSPILLSDLPAVCVNFLKKQGDQTVNLRDSERETFAANVFDLYRRSFFMMDGLIGSFAQTKIEEIKQRIDDNVDPDLIEKEISLIGDERIRYYLRHLLWENPENEIAYHERRLKELRRESRNE